MRKLCLKVMIGEMTEDLIYEIIILIILLLLSQYFVSCLSIILTVLLPIFNALKLYFKLKKMPSEVQSVIERNINDPVFFYWRTCAIFEDYIINLYKCNYYKVQDIIKIDVKSGPFIRRLCCFLHITTKDGKKSRMPYKIDGLEFKYYKDMFKYLFEKNPDIEIVDNFWKLEELQKGINHND